MCTDYSPISVVCPQHKQRVPSHLVADTALRFYYCLTRKIYVFVLPLIVRYTYWDIHGNKEAERIKCVIVDGVIVGIKIQGFDSLYKDK